MPGKNILILNGSPRKKGNSVILAEQVANGARDTGAQVETFFLHLMNIQPCDACDVCQGSTNYECIVQDDMHILYPKLKQADAIVLASPVYWFTMSAQTKLCIDRWYALQNQHGNALQGKELGVILTYGDVDPYISGAINAIRTYQDMCRYLGVHLIGIVYGSATDPDEIRGNTALLEQAHNLGIKLGGKEKKN